jgi:glyoxylase-like metal-dependent hydrolase (beta-lactamase superfamily II)
MKARFTVDVRLTRILFRMGLLGLGLLGIGLFGIGSFSLNAVAAETGNLVPRESVPYPADMLQRVRLASVAVPGELATSINFTKVAESHRPYAAIIDGGSDDTFVSARTAFQIRFPAGSIMLDTGMDQEVHRTYGFGRVEPYWQDANDNVQSALRDARLIIITHEHGDHVAGVIRSDYRDELVSKTILTKDQVRTLTFAAQIPQIKLTPEQARDYVVVDYELLLPVAPGVVLIKSPGHTPGHQMVYVQLAKGEEFLFIGDIGWSLDNITKLKLRPAATIARVKEDPQALMNQMIWIKQVMDEDGLIIIPSHDDRLLTRYVEEGLLGTSLQQ